MKAITLGDGSVQFRSDWPEPDPAVDEVVVEVSLAGICETDLQLARGYMGFAGVLGHEFVGIATSGRWSGRRVVGEINCNCRQCPRCRQGLGNHCANRTVVGIDRHDGAFAQRVAIPEHNLHPIPDEVDDDQAVFVEPLAAALEINQQLELSNSDRIVVVGDGRLALLCAQTLSLVSKRVTVIGKHPTKLARFERLGFETIGLEAVEPNQSFDVAIDCSGSATGLPLALQLVRPRGVVVLKTTVAADHQLSLASIVIDELSIIGSRCGPFDKAIDALKADQVDLSGLITHRYSLHDANDAFTSATAPDAFKVVFQIGSSERG